MLINLLGNAIKFTQSGSIVVKVETKEDRVENDSTWALHISVKDSGIGIPEDEVDSIFDAFVQRGDLYTDQHGTGLGLPISDRFVKLLGGTIEVESEVGKGTCFMVSVPIQQAVNPQPSGPLRARRVVGLAANQPSYRLLVAEDNTTNRNLLVTLLQSVGFVVREAINGQEALDIWRQWQPHLIWMDMRMPLMDGYLVTSLIKEEIKTSKMSCDTKIIALTASAFERDRQKFFDHGGNDFVRKPFSENEVFAVLEKNLGVVFEYISGRELDNDDTGESTIATMQSAIRTIPDQVISRLKEAAELSDAAEIDRVILEIQDIDTGLADYLLMLAEKYAYDDLLTLLTEAQRG